MIVRVRIVHKRTVQTLRHHVQRSSSTVRPRAYSSETFLKCYYAELFFLLQFIPLLIIRQIAIIWNDLSLQAADKPAENHQYPVRHYSVRKAQAGNYSRKRSLSFFLYVYKNMFAVMQALAPLK